jgi:hypothetical protein
MRNLLFALGGLVVVGLAVMAIWPVVAEAPWEESGPTEAAALPAPTSLPTQTRCDELEDRLAQASEPGAVALIRGLLQDEGCLGQPIQGLKFTRWKYVPAEDAANAENYPGSGPPPCSDFTFTSSRTAYPNSEPYTDRFGTWVAVECVEYQ